MCIYAHRFFSVEPKQRSKGPCLGQCGPEGEGCEQATKDVLVECSSFMSIYSMAEKGAEMIDGWRKNAPTSSEAYKEQLAKAHVSIAVAHVASTMPAPDVSLQKKPHKGVISNGDHKPGSLHLVPETTRVSLIASSSELPASGLLCKVPKALTEKRVVLLPQFSDTFACPAWALHFVEDESKANVGIEFKKTTVTASNSGGKNTGGKGCSKYELHVPVYVNVKPIIAGEELLVYRAPPTKKHTAKRGLELALTDEPDAKRR